MTDTLITIEYTDKYKSKYRYGKLYPIGITRGSNIETKLKSDKWEILERKDHITVMNDNRLDRDYGFTQKYKHKVDLMKLSGV